MSALVQEQLDDHEATQALKTFILRIQQNFDKAINAVADIIHVRQIPERALEGKLYYLTENIEGTENATKGYWIWLWDKETNTGKYEKLVVGSELNALKDRVAALENV